MAKNGYKLILPNFNLVHDVCTLLYSKLNVNFFLTEEMTCVRESTNSEDPYTVAVMCRRAVTQN